MDMEQSVRGFLKTLHRNRREWALKQIHGRIEDDLARAFALFAERTNPQFMALFNTGNRIRRFDVVLGPKSRTKGLPQLNHVSHLLEVKYVRNRHGRTEYDASDEVTTTLKSLKRQISRVPPTVGQIDVRLRGNQVYGLLFASSLERPDHDDRTKNKEDFRDFITERLQKLGLVYTDLQSPHRIAVFENVDVGDGFLASMDAWMLRIRPGR
jgi:hypothetical protein